VPPLRNVAFTTPYMHNGAFSTLEEVIQHYRDKGPHSQAYTGQWLTQQELVPTLLPVGPVLQNLSIPFTFIPSDFTVKEMADLKAFLESLTDPQAINRTQEIPAAVPSGLPVDRG
jgi:cytochrome c peroxidase